VNATYRASPEMVGSSLRSSPWRPSARPGGTARDQRRRGRLDRRLAGAAPRHPSRPVGWRSCHVQRQTRLPSGSASTQ
jgi:hypothetical protein